MKPTQQVVKKLAQAERQKTLLEQQLEESINLEQSKNLHPQYEAYHEVMEEAKELVLRKGNTRNQGSIHIIDYATDVRSYVRSFFPMIHIKYMRLKAIFEGLCIKGFMSIDEEKALIDDCMDLINYAAFEVMLHKTGGQASVSTLPGNRPES